MAELGPLTNSFIGEITKPVTPLWDHVIVCQMLPSGTATPNTLYQITSVTDYNTLFGFGSSLAFKIAIYKALFPNGKLFVIPVAENVSGIAPTQTSTITGVQVENESRDFVAGGKKYTISILTTDTPTTVAGKIVSAITADTSAMVTATNLAGVITITHKTKGTLYNNSPVGFIEPLTSGMTCTVTPFSGGAVDPVLTTAIFENVIGDQRCNLYVPHYAFKVANDYMLTKVNVQGNVLSGFIFSCIRDTKANILNYSTVNYPKSKYAVLLVDYLEETSTSIKGAGRTFLDNVNVLGASLFAYLDKMVQNGEWLGDNVINTTNYGFDSGLATLNRPTRDILFKNLTPNDKKYQLKALEQEELRNKGYSSVKFYTDGNAVATNDLITTDYDAQKLQGRYGVFSHLRSLRIAEYVQGYLLKELSFFLSDKNAGGINSTDPKNVNFDIVKAFIQDRLERLMQGGEVRLLSLFTDRRQLDGASYKDIYDNKIKSEQGFSWRGSNGVYSCYTPLMIDGNLENVTLTILPQYIN